MVLKAIDSAKDKLYYDVKPQEMNADGPNNNFGDVSVFSTNPSENADTPNNPQMEECAAKYAEKATQIIAENETKNKKILEKVVPEIEKQANQKLEAICLGALGGGGGDYLDTSEKTASDGGIYVISKLSQDSLTATIVLYDMVKFKKVVENKLEDGAHLTQMEKTISVPVKNDQLKKVAMNYLVGKGHLERAKTMPPGTIVLETELRNNQTVPILTAEKFVDGYGKVTKVTFSFTKESANFNVEYSAQELDIQGQQADKTIAAGDKTLESDTKDDSTTALQGGAEIGNFAGSGLSQNIADSPVMQIMPMFNTLS